MRPKNKFAFFLFSLLCLCQVHADPLDRTIAIVNDGVISQVELTQRLNLAKKHLSLNPSIPDSVLQAQLLDQMILEKIEQQMAERSGIQIQDALVEQTIQSIAEENQLSLMDFQKRLRTDGIAYEQFREQIRSDLMIQQLQKRDLANQIVVSEREIDQYLRSKEGQDVAGAEYRVGHILIALPPAPSSTQIAQAQAETAKLLEQLRHGEDFAATAIRHSKSPQALQGGDLGWRKAEELPTLFGQKVLEMKAGQIAGPYRNASGFHIIKLNDKRTAYGEMTPIQTHIRHILVKTNVAVSSEQALSQVKLLRAMVKNKKDFGAIARAHSDDMGTRESGGELGWVSSNEVPDAFRQAMNRLPEHTISEPFQTAEGWHIIEVLGRRELPLGDEWTREKALRILQARKFEEKLNDWQRQLRDQSFIEVL